MSSYFGSLDVSGLNSSQGDRYKIDTLFKKYLGYANRNVDIASEYIEDATSRIGAKYVQTQIIPEDAPALGTAVTPGGQTYKVYTPTSAQYSYIKKYEDVPFVSDSSKPDSIFTCSLTDANGVSLIKNIIPTNYGTNGNGGYGITVKVGVNTVLPKYYILDRDAGIIVFYGYNSVSRTNLPKITFWRYEGTYGFDNLASNFSIGDVSEGAVGSLPVVTLSDNGSGGKAFNFTLPAPYSGSDGADGADGVDGSDAKQVVLSGVDIQYTTNPADVSGYFIAETETETTKPYTLHLVVKAGADGQDGAVGSPGSDVVYAILNYTYTFSPAPSITNGVGTVYSISVPNSLAYSAGQDIVVCSKETPESATPNKLYADVLSYTENIADASLNFIVKEITSTSIEGWTVEKQYDINVNEIPTAVGGWQAGNNAQTQTFNLRDIGIGVASPEAALDVSGAVKLRDTLTVASDISGEGELRIDGSADLKSTLSVTGAVDLKSTLAVASDISGEGELRVGGAVDLKSTLTVADDISGAGDLHITGDIYLGGTLKDSAGNSIQLADGFGNSIYSDNYIAQKFTSTPPAPTLKDTSDALYINGNYKQYQTLTEIGFSFNNPEQIAFGDMWVPHIKSVRVEVSGTSIIYLCESLIPKTGNEITAIILSKINGTDGKYTRTIKSNGTNISETAYVKYGISSSFASGTIVRIGYRNNINNSSADINYLSVPLETFIAAFPPVAPTNLSVNTPNSNFLTNNTNISWSAPIHATKDPGTGAGINQTGIVIDGYNVDISETGIVAGTKRYGTTATAYNKPKTTKTLDATTSTSFTATPRTTYSIQVSAKNNQNTSYGDVSSTVYSTGYPTEPADGPTNNLNYPAESFNVSTIRPVGAASDVASSSPVYRYGTVTSFTPTNTLDGIKLHNATTVGDTMSRTVTFTGTRAGANLFTEAMSVSGDFINDGSYVNTSLSNVSIASLQKSDVNTGDLAGYYQRFSMKPVLSLSNTTLFPASSGEYALSIGFGNSADNTDKPYSFYLEDFDTTSTPSITCDEPVLSINSITTKKISGISIAKSDDTSTKVIFNNIDVSGIGKYFYNSSWVYRIYSDAPYFFPNTSEQKNLPSGTIAPISTIRYDISEIKLQSNSITGVTDNVTFKLDALNINGNTATQVLKTVPIRFDRNTYLFNYSSSILTTGTTNSVYRTEYMLPSDGLPSAVVYDNSQIIVSNTSNTRYNSEIPMFDGLFRFENTASYIIESETGFRYSTFAWVTPNATVNTLQFKLKSFFSETNSLSYDSVSSKILSNDTYRVYYRFEHVLNGVVQSPSSSNYSSYWMDATTAFTGTNMGTNYAIQVGTSGLANTNNGDSGALTSAFTINSGVATHTVFAHAATFSATSYLRIYLTIGIKPNTHRFGYVECSYT